jgi:hypothetical protein
MKIIYRISEGGYPKEKPDYITKINCLKNALKHFKQEDFLLIMDNVSDNLKSEIEKVYGGKAHLVQVGHGAGTFNIALDHAIGKTGILSVSDDEIIYFLEDDYLHKEGSQRIIEDGFELGMDYVTLYDHPDKYLNPIEGGNPYCEGRAEFTRVYLGNNSHFKLTNSSTMTFAAKVKTLKEDEGVMRSWTNGTHPHDFQMFQEINKKGRRLVSPLPGYSTHGETRWLTPLTNWENI